jgi:maltose phosphorylase
MYGIRGGATMNECMYDEAWSIVEDGFDPKRQKSMESLLSLGNGHMGQRANFEEAYSGDTLQGSYVAGIYYPDKTRVGWWKNGYPEYFAKVLNSPNWIGIDVVVNGTPLDLAKCRVEKYRRTLNMKDGTLCRRFEAILPDGARIAVATRRFLSMAEPEIGVIEYAVTALADAKLILSPYIEGNVRNQDANYDETFWDILETAAAANDGLVLARTKRLDFTVAFAMQSSCSIGHAIVAPEYGTDPTRTENRYAVSLRCGETVVLRKYVAVTTSLDYDAAAVSGQAGAKAAAAAARGYEALLGDHVSRWADIWQNSDIAIEGDVAAQQGIRFNIFHLNQTYTGADERLNVGPKGFTGEKYGGCTYWDTEAFCIPFFLATAPSRVTRNLLLYRYRHLERAIENAAKLGFPDGAALYPMVTMNGEECHNEWEITFEEIHRNGIIAYAIYNYIQHTHDERYLADYGLEVLIAIARFWCQRASFSKARGKYVILGVTGPNEYENNVNNNWYTNTLACWCLRYAADAAALVSRNWPRQYERIATKTGFSASREVEAWNRVRENMYFPYDECRNLFLQQDGYLDKEESVAADIPPAERPINQNWSWDRILRSPYIKQADLLQGVYLFEDRYDEDFIRRHFAYYEARTVHESSLSPCIHAVLAARIGDIDKAYDLYLRTSRLDLDDYNREVEDGLHITSMAGTWMAIVEGFGGKRMREGKLHLSPQIHKKWKRYAFRLVLGNRPLYVSVTADTVEILYRGPEPVTISVYGVDRVLQPGLPLTISRSTQ